MEKKKIIFLFLIIPFLLVFFVLVNTPRQKAEDTTTVLVKDENENKLATVKVKTAETPQEKYIGLSNTEKLQNGSGMLFVYSNEAKRSFVMRDMNFPLDIIFISSDGHINRIYQAPLPSKTIFENELRSYTANAKWVLEVPKGYTQSHNISQGDRVEIRRP